MNLDLIRILQRKKISTELSYTLIIPLGIVYLFVSLLNGLYPAFVLSRYKPVEALKERIV